MLESLLQTSTYPITKKKRDDYFVVSESKSASTYLDLDKLRENYFGVGNLVTYKSHPMLRIEKDGMVSPIKNSISVLVPFRLGGKISQPPIDDDDLVFFDD